MVCTFKQMVCRGSLTEELCLADIKIEVSIFFEDGHQHGNELEGCRQFLVRMFQPCFYETIKSELNNRLVKDLWYECRCDERRKAKTERSKRLACTVRIDDGCPQHDTRRSGGDFQVHVHGVTDRQDTPPLHMTCNNRMKFPKNATPVSLSSHRHLYI